MSERSASILVVANPAAGNGTGTQAARRAMGEMEAAIARGKTSATFAGAEVDAAFLSSPEQTRDVVEKSGGIRAVIAIGGDGLAHLVVNALMSIPAEERPVFGIIAAGTGNDYARALGCPSTCESARRRCCMPAHGSWMWGSATISISPRRFPLGWMQPLRSIRSSGAPRPAGRMRACMFRAVSTSCATILSIATIVPTSMASRLRGKALPLPCRLARTTVAASRSVPRRRSTTGTLDICISHPPAGVARAIYIFMARKKRQARGHEAHGVFARSSCDHRL